MWVTQSYLGDPDQDARVHVYYLFENYNSDQVEFSKSIERQLAHIGDQFGPKATILMPNPANAPRIHNEVVRLLEPLWHELQGQLPGLLVSTRKLTEIDLVEGNHQYFSLANCSEREAAEVVNEAHRLMWQITQHQQEGNAELERETAWQRLVDAIEVKPGAFGVSIDIRKLIGR